MTDPTPSSRPVAGEEAIPGSFCSEQVEQFSAAKTESPQNPALSLADVLRAHADGCTAVAGSRSRYHTVAVRDAAIVEAAQLRTAADALDALREAGHGCGIAMNSQEPTVRCGIRSSNWRRTPLCSDCARKAADAINTLLGGDDA